MLTVRKSQGHIATILAISEGFMDHITGMDVLTNMCEARAVWKEQCDPAGAQVPSGHALAVESTAPPQPHHDDHWTIVGSLQVQTGSIVQNHVP